MEWCQHCLVDPVFVGTSCERCAVECAEPDCENLADVSEVGMLCPAHVPPDNTLPVEEPE